MGIHHNTGNIWDQANVFVIVCIIANNTHLSQCLFLFQIRYDALLNDFPFAFYLFSKFVSYLIFYLYNQQDMERKSATKVTPILMMLMLVEGDGVSE